MADTPERKKITLKPGAASPRSAEADVAPRQRSGSRAHRVTRRQTREQALAPAPHGEDPARPALKPKPTRPAPKPAREPAAENRPGRPGPRVRADAGTGIDRPPRGRDRDRNASRPRDATRAQHPGFAAESFAIFAPCPQGLEQALADELTQLGFTGVQATRAGCGFNADWQGMMRANLHSRLATRILVQVGQAPVTREDDILELARNIPWERWFGPDHTLRVDTSAVRSPMQSLQYCNLRAKDGICDRLREIEGARPDIDTVRPDARVHLFLNETTATLYLDSSGESLFKRGWRHDKGEAPLRENLAAGLLALAGWRGDTPLIDPFCGSGTIMIEAAYLALRVPPGISRPFAFERLRNHEAHIWYALKDDARARIRPRLEIPLIGSDLDARALDAARSNADRALLTPDAITFELRDARELRPTEGPPGWIVTNPPYGERLDHTSANLWGEFAQTLKAHFGGWQVHIITSDRDLPAQMRLAAQRRTPLYNGALDCRLFGFELVSGSFRQRI